MAKNKKTFEQHQKEYEKVILKALDKNPDIYNITDLSLIVPFARSTIYNYDLDKLDTIKEKLEENKVNFKRVLRNRMQKTNNATCLIALYKLLATAEEKDALSNNRVDVNANVGISTQEVFLQHLKDMGNNAD